MTLTKGQKAKIITTRRYKIKELTNDEKVVIYNRQIWRPTNEIEISIPNNILNYYTHVDMNVTDYNGDIIDVKMKKTKNGNYITYKIEPYGSNRKRFYIMDKLIITFRQT